MTLSGAIIAWNEGAFKARSTKEPMRHDNKEGEEVEEETREVLEDTVEGRQLKRHESRKKLTIRLTLHLFYPLSLC